MKYILAIAVAAALLVPAFGDDKCVECHNTQGPLLAASAHPSLSCTDCHNGNGKGDTADDAHDLKMKFVGRPAPTAVSAMCGDCHGNQAKDYLKSAHAVALAAGRNEAATCVSCHTNATTMTAHAIVPAYEDGSPTTRPLVPEMCARCHSDAATMAPSRIRIDQFAQYKESAHGRHILGQKGTDAATCTDCHNAHDILKASDPASTISKLNQAKTCGGCHGDEDFMKKYGHPADVVPEYESSPHSRNLAGGAPSCAGCHGPHSARIPPASEIRQLCGRCHAGPAKELSLGAHGKAMHADESGNSVPLNCADCHEPHAAPHPERPFATAVCAPCHDKSGHEVAAGFEIGSVTLSTSADIARLRQRLQKAELRGHDVAEHKEALAALEGSYHDEVAMVHAVSADRIKAHRAVSAKMAAELEARLAPLVPEKRDIGWLAWVWGFLFAGVAMMFVKSRAVRARQSS